jgi:hypothetical protein
MNGHVGSQMRMQAKVWQSRMVMAELYTLRSCCRWQV